MAKIERFEDLEVWQTSMKLCADIYRITNSEMFSKDFGLKDQIRRSAVSVPSNISEGYERDSKRQFMYFLVIAKGSCGELRTQLRIARDLNYIEETVYSEINDQCVSTSKQLKGFINYLSTYKEKK